MLGEALYPRRGVARARVERDPHAGRVRSNPASSPRCGTPRISSGPAPDLGQHVVGGQHPRHRRPLHQPGEERRVARSHPPPGRPGPSPLTAGRVPADAGRERRRGGLQPLLQVDDPAAGGLGPQRGQLGAHPGGRGRRRPVRVAGVRVQLHHRAAGAGRPLRRRALQPRVDRDRVERGLPADGVERGPVGGDVAVEPEPGDRERRGHGRAPPPCAASRGAAAAATGGGGEQGPQRARLGGQHQVAGVAPRRRRRARRASGAPSAGVIARAAVPVRTCAPCLSR